ncbi:hypothetical protein SAMN05428945_4606 [Streptomyces sp. 2224.1]|uniref:hypothetical protein n=1 Tax=unclassified Streptomyces TaxID=2593676 RepID=UPI00088C8891|nr:MULTISPECIES: hypothetical protein [unclassified Streptomyces]PBC80884.1 hypothetical protein BX261_0732 [Streptomyces sp. 2321.6]SDR56995.1 hypothetical protein SAMN05216511_6488 [Streptomyces sp. KS_16]SEB92469.1 hypothetical protein SAMN05428940_0731 [Streptomyces sp. 2133.1]SED33927.1 hypothetical protein SAMN05428945_4606 [Streptomyces sp. 2224.1]SEF12150.1 hypothetical protein SAMN05428954_6542 [Streptomyces sp. 2112.3]
MRTRTWFAGLAVGVALLAGGSVATAQAAPAPSPTSTTAAVPGYWHYDGSYSKSTCLSLAASYAGPAYCTQRGSLWALYIWVE